MLCTTQCPPSHASVICGEHLCQWVSVCLQVLNNTTSRKKKNGKKKEWVGSMLSIVLFHLFLLSWLFLSFFGGLGGGSGGQPLIKQTALERQEIEVRQAAAARRLWLKQTLSCFN